MEETQVCIIGAGFAGISAAKELYESGIDFILLEGSDYIGGRVKSEQINGFQVEMGANWIHSPKSAGKNPHNTMWRYKEELGMEGVFTNFINFDLFSVEGDKVGDLALYGPYTKLMKALRKCGKKLEEDISVA